MQDKQEFKQLIKQAILEIKQEHNLKNRIKLVADIKDKLKDTMKQKLKKVVHSSKFKRSKDKNGFVLGVVNLFISSFLIGYNPYYYQQYYIFKLIVMYLIRFSRYVMKNMHLYTIDFCYYANFLNVLFYFYGNNNPDFFNMIFMYNNGPLIWAVPLFRNSLIFHSLEKITCLLIHFSGPLFVFSIKWLDKENRFNQMNTNINIWNYYYYGIMGYLAWSVFYYFMTFIIISKKNRHKYVNLFSQFTANPKSGYYKYCYSLGEKYSGLMFMSIHFFWYLLSSSSSLLTIHSYYLHLVIMMGCFGLSIWNGANYYMEYFSKKYEKSLQRLDELQVEIENNINIETDKSD